jgi:hypothetical protein
MPAQPTLLVVWVHSKLIKQRRQYVRARFDSVISSVKPVATQRGGWGDDYCTPSHKERIVVSVVNGLLPTF